ncbi:diguanylate cyclase (GGDEF)-like protein/PAS domain S-box-containing protein [Metabacillus malikii]|uniref:Diguanylate cyclase (GGDEF)-like protein/PAS domain S-box-containing protein n=2 Tax=Metabacillus malikii TaxID=1504265 RepID=A0ABT9Z9K7_9BACI|nr:diguanylate cyclase (GGDEF)-like protein/PAS domain S-box-containing protein [Metabacillus malikii]
MQKPFHEFIDHDYIEVTVRHFRIAVNGKPSTFETVCFHKQGHRVHLEVTNFPIIVDGKIIGVYGIAKDISKEKVTLRLVEENEERYRSLFEHNLDAIFEVDKNGTYINMNHMAEKLTGFSKEELINMNITSIIPKNSEKLFNAFLSVLNGRAQRGEHSLVNKTGQLVQVDTTAVPINKNGNIEGVFAIVRDITDKTQYEMKIKEMAYRDQLTGLPNRNWFYSKIQEVMEHAKLSSKHFAILAIDFDNFKNINDTFGHSGGDQFLMKVSSILRSILRTKDQISRIGGDEFVIISEDTTENEIRQLAEDIINKMNQTIILQDMESAVTLSIGITVFKNNSETVETLLKQADLALYNAKKKGKNNYQFFTESLSKEATRRSLLENALSKAISNNEFHLHYQPQIDLSTGELVGVEALLRWNSPYGFVSPIEFIPIAEETNLILPIGEWVMKEACRQINRWKKLGLPNLVVSVNVSARQFHDETFPQKVKEILESEHVDGHLFEIEITETVMLNIEAATKKIEDIRKLGVKIAIDDFGAGYSSLNVINSIDIDTLKIDKLLIDHMMENKRSMSILLTIINVGKDINAKVIIEGVETKEQVQLLKSLNVIAQGYYFSRPLPNEELQSIWLTNWRKLID